MREATHEDDRPSDADEGRRTLMRGLLGAAGLLALKGCAAPTREAEAAAVAQALAGGVSWIPTATRPRRRSPTPST